MAHQEWLDRLRRELNRRRLPPAYAARLLEEWADHFHDLQKENQGMDALNNAEERLGTPESLAASAEREYMRRTCAGRRPWLVFLMAPLPLYFGAFMALGFPCVAAKSWVAPIDGPIVTEPSTLAWVVTYASVYALAFLPPLLAAALFCRLGKRAGRPAWGFASCLMLAYLAFISHLGVHPPTETHNLSGFMGWELGFSQWPERLAQAIPPLALGIWTWLSVLRSRNGSESQLLESPLMGLGTA